MGRTRADACGAPTAGGMRARHWWLFVVSLAICFQGVKADKENIVKLTKFNFDDNVKRGAWFVKFYAPWCTHCQRLAPIWEKLADQAVSQDWPVKIADVDCTVSKTICEKANIKAFPTLALISEGKLKGKYSGEATASAFQTWLAEQGVLQVECGTRCQAERNDGNNGAIWSLGDATKRGQSAETVGSMVRKLSTEKSHHSTSSDGVESRGQRNSGGALSRIFGLYQFNRRVTLARSMFASFTQDSQKASLGANS
eukprot:s1325_g6.t1